jgi:hypothetical protein
MKVQRLPVHKRVVFNIDGTSHLVMRFAISKSARVGYIRSMSIVTKTGRIKPLKIELIDDVTAEIVEHTL